MPDVKTCPTCGQPFPSLEANPLAPAPWLQRDFPYREGPERPKASLPVGTPLHTQPIRWAASAKFLLWIAGLMCIVAGLTENAKLNEADRSQSRVDDSVNTFSMRLGNLTGQFPTSMRKTAASDRTIVYVFAFLGVGLICTGFICWVSEGRIST